NQQRPRLARHRGEGAGRLHRVHLEARGRKNGGEPPARGRGTIREDAHERSAVEGSEISGIQFRWAGDRVRLRASRRHGERPCGGMLPACAVREARRKTPPMTLPDALGIFGSLLIVVAYFANLRSLLTTTGLAYSLLNLIGAALILFSLGWAWNIAAAVMEGFWA